MNKTAAPVKHYAWTILLLVFIVACSDDPAAPEARAWNNRDLIGEWTGQLPVLAMVPDSSFPYWPGYQTHPLYNRRYDFMNLDASVNITQSQFLIMLQYRSDSLYFIYQEKGGWELAGGATPQLVMDNTSITGRLETWDWQVNWDTSGCCWQAELDLLNGDPGSAGLGVSILKFTDIRGRVDIAALRLERQLN
jgi:hypothetical protein